MGITERHWFEDEEPELTDRQLEDAVYDDKKIVRCKNCKYGHHVINSVNGEVRIYRVICVKPYEQGSAVHEPDWFCADGKRKEGR